MPLPYKEPSVTTRVICDSSCNIPENYLQSLNIVQVPGWINFFVGASLHNDVDISDEEFYVRPMLHYADGRKSGQAGHVGSVRSLS